MEIWKDVVGYEGIYEVSNLGEIRTHKNKTSFSKRYGVERKWKQRVLKQKVSKDKCCRVNLWKDGKEKTWLVHRLVAFAFLPLEESKNYVNHKDGNRLNNNIENLEWCDHAENNNHAFDNRLIKTGQEIILLNKVTKETHYFRSKTKASEFLGKYHGFISDQIKKGVNEYNDYVFFAQASEAIE